MVLPKAACRCMQSSEQPVWWSSEQPVWWHTSPENCGAALLQFKYFVGSWIVLSAMLWIEADQGSVCTESRVHGPHFHTKVLLVAEG